MVTWLGPMVIGVMFAVGASVLAGLIVRSFQIRGLPAFVFGLLFGAAIGSLTYTVTHILESRP
jgi:hypothetical protein